MKYLVTLTVLLLSVLSSGYSNAQWVQTNGPCEGTVNCFAVGGINLSAGTASGVYLSVNNGISWTSVNNGLPASSYITALVVSGANIFAGTNGSGVYFSLRIMEPIGLRLIMD